MSRQAGFPLHRVDFGTVYSLTAFMRTNPARLYCAHTSKATAQIEHLVLASNHTWIYTLQAPGLDCICGCRYSCGTHRRVLAWQNGQRCSGNVARGWSCCQLQICTLTISFAHPHPHYMHRCPPVFERLSSDLVMATMHILSGDAPWLAASSRSVAMSALVPSRCVSMF